MKSKDIERSIFSRNLIKFRKAKGLTQIQLAEKSGISKRVIAYYETQVSNPPLDNLVALSETLQVSINELIGKKDSSHIDMFEDVDMRTLKKIMQIKFLPKTDRTTIYNMIDALLQKNGITPEKDSQ